MSGFGGPGVGGPSGNVYRGSAGQTGYNNQQFNYYPPPPPPSRGPRWLVVAGAVALVLTGGVVIALIKLAGAFGDGAKGAERTPQNPVVSPDAASAQAGPVGSPESVTSPSTAPGTASPAGSDPVHWENAVRITEMGPTLDTKPPRLVTYGRDLHLALVYPPQVAESDSLNNPSNLAVWPGPGVPGRKQCLDLVSAQGIAMTEVKKGTVLCVRTGGGRIARLTVTTASNDPTVGVEARTTVWSEVLEQ
ncbi:hypothetical protein [Streptomyces sp. NPDC006368]|uniref:hypothetical protein n=1 Tax=Streptomyces sp. NPDC006368 TaxID=3156760 RepID=UPI00339F8E74